jgi:DNA-binding HxlR family transcriptional regulator
MAGYVQFCPVAKAMELLDERWTMLVIRELLCGSRHFNALRRGVPRMSPTLLSARLKTLVRAGIVERYDEGRQVTYALTRPPNSSDPWSRRSGSGARAGCRSSVTRTTTPTF